MKLLIVDDNRGCCDLYTMRFELDKWEVKVAFSAEKALDILRGDYLPDAILLDIMLPKMQGDELLKILRDYPKTKDIVIVILSAISFSTDDQEKSTKLKSLADDFLLKIEVTPGNLVKRVTELV